MNKNVLANSIFPDEVDIYFERLAEISDWSISLKGSNIRKQNSKIIFSTTLFQFHLFIYLQSKKRLEIRKMTVL